VTNATSAVLDRLADGPPVTRVTSTSSEPGWAWVALVAAQVPLALALDRMPSLATVHALATVAVGLKFGASGRSPERVAYVGAYIAGAEVLWRMTEAHVFWEFGKYAVVSIFLAAMFRMKRWRWDVPPFAYFALLLPSAAMTAIELDLGDTREQISFNLSGPLALAISAWFFSQLELSHGQLQRVMVALVAPAVGIASLTLFLTLTHPDLKFTGESNFATSGGFGPNQVSSILGLGAMLALFYLLNDSRNLWLTATMFVGVILLAAQSAMTFSRGGLYNAAAGAIVGFLFLITDARSRLKLLLVAALLFVVAHYVLLPKLDTFTSGTLSERFQDTDPTGRDSLVQSDLRIWADHPVLGVGPGQAKQHRQLHGVAAHTEFSRLLAEHGSAGLAALVLLLFTAVRNVRRPPGQREKAIVAALLGWSFLYMVNAAMRLVAPSFAFGLTFARLAPRDAGVRSPATSRSRGRRRVGPVRLTVIRAGRRRAHLAAS
jgi:hypothetical protein